MLATISSTDWLNGTRTFQDSVLSSLDQVFGRGTLAQVVSIVRIYSFA